MHRGSFDRRAAAVWWVGRVVGLVLAVAVPVMHSIVPAPPAMSGQHTVGPSAHSMTTAANIEYQRAIRDGAALRAAEMGGCSDHLCPATMRPASALHPPTALAAGIAFSSADPPWFPVFVAGPPPRAPPQDVSLTRLCVCRT